LNILALDLGTQTGWAWHQRGGKIVSGTASFSAGKLEGPGQRWLKFRRFLTDTMPLDVHVCYYERVLHHTAVRAAHVYGAFEAHVQVWADINRVRLVQVSPMTIKKFWTGFGNVKKDAMLAEAIRRGFRPHDDNEADALALLHYAMKEELEEKPAPF
jgi:Holliday junction resolvasome RuvABC endonuclease subunit